MAPAAAVRNNSPTHHRGGGGGGGRASPESCSSSSSSSNIRQTRTHLTYSRHHLIDTARETIKIAETGQYTNSKGRIVYLKDDLDYAVENSAHYEHEFDFYDALQRHDDFARLEAGLIMAAGGAEDDNKASSPNVDRLGSLKSSKILKFSFSEDNDDGGSGGGGGPSPSRRRFPRTSFLVVSASWLESAHELQRAHGNNNDDGGMRVGVLNSASGTTPGGRFLKGTVSQEDCLCRASLLYSCISQPKFQSEGRFYGKNRSLRYGTSNCVIFSPDVPVIREDNVEGKLLDEIEKVSIVNIPAPNAFSTSSSTGKEYNDIESDERENVIRHSRNASVVDSLFPGPETADDFDEKFERKRRALLSSLSDRIHRALSAFVLGNCTDLVLPAFGCGVHGNDPTMVAGVFREMLTDPKQFGGRFRTVVFAVPPSRKQNYQAFAAYFHNKGTVKRVNMKRGAATVD